MRDLKKKLAGMGIEKNWGPADQESMPAGASKKMNQGHVSSREPKAVNNFNKRFMAGKAGLLQRAIHGETLPEMKAGQNGKKPELSRLNGAEHNQKTGTGRRFTGLHGGKAVKPLGGHGVETRQHITWTPDNLSGCVPSESTLLTGAETKKPTVFQDQKHPHHASRDGAKSLDGVSGKGRKPDWSRLSKTCARPVSQIEEGEKGHSTHNLRVPGSRAAGGKQVLLADQVVVKDHPEHVLAESRVSTQDVLSGSDVLQRKKEALFGRGKNVKQTVSHDKQSVHKNHHASSGRKFSSGEEESFPPPAEDSKSQRVREHTRGLLNQQFSKDDIMLPSPGHKPLGKKHLYVDVPADHRLDFSQLQRSEASERSVDLFGNEQRTLLVKKVFEAISSTIRKAPREILLKLEPETLGKLRIKVSVERDQISTRIMAEHQKVVTLFKGCHGDLQQHLKEQGFQLGSFDVSQDHSAGQDFSGSSTGQESFHGSGDGSAQGSSGKTMGPQEELVQSSSTGRITDREVNVTV
jgi:hypothetical protein